MSAILDDMIDRRQTQLAAQETIAIEEARTNRERHESRMLMGCYMREQTCYLLIDLERPSRTDGPHGG